MINQRQFKAPGLRWPVDYRYPDETYRDDLALEVGGERFELHHARGETDDGTWVWAPERKVVFAGDLFIWASPNCGNPQKVQRYARDWIAAFRAMAALQPDVLLPGHGLPIIGADRVRQALEDGAELLETLARPDARDDERGRAPRRHRAHACARPNTCSRVRTSGRSTTSPSSWCATSGATTAAGTTVIRRT